MKIIKIIAIGIVGIMSSLAMAGYIARFLESGDFGATQLAFFFATLFSAMAVLEAFLIKRAPILILLAFFQAVAPLALFTTKLKSPEGRALLFLAAAFLFIFQIIGMHGGRATLENSLKIKAFQAAKAVTPKITTGIILFASILFYLSYFVWGGWSDAIGKRLSDSAWHGAEPILKVWIDGARADQTVDEFLRAATEAEIRKSKTKAAQEGNAEFDLDLLTPEEREARMGEIVGKVKGKLERFTGPFQGNEKMNEVVYQTLKRQVENASLASKEFSRFAGVIVAIIVFGLLKSLAFIVNWVAEIGAVAALNLLLAVGFAEVSFESASREKIEL